MKPLLWLAAGGGVLYLLYERGFFGTAAPAVTSGTSTSPQANTSTSVTSGSTTGSTLNNTQSTTAVMVPAPNGGHVPMPTTLAALKQYVHNWAVADPNFVTMTSGQFTGQLMATPYQWNFYVNYGVPSTSGNPLTSSMFAGTNAQSNMSAAVTENQFWAAVGPTLSGYGLSGWPGWGAGMGMIAHNVNPYLQGPRGDVRQIFGAGAAPTGPETMIVRRSDG